MKLKFTDIVSVTVWYFIFGVAHECIHLTTGILLGVINYEHVVAHWKSMTADVLFHRQINIPCTELNSTCLYDWRLVLIRHAGWLFSVILAIFIHQRYRHGKAKAIGTYSFLGSNWCSTAAIITALDAMATDLLSLGKLSFSDQSAFISTTISSNRFNSVVLYCGNFGVILLSGAWFGNGGKTALDILEKMIHVTMMRGAQSGGVVTFDSKESKDAIDDSNSAISMIGTRTRIVKSKREDLSKVLRSMIEKRSGAIASTMKHVKFFAGHTRFATTSKASFDGTHPHQWSKPRFCHVYKMDELLPETNNDNFLGLSNLNNRLRNRTRTAISKSSSVRVENFITHNGDFEFYELNNRMYEIDTVQKFLEHATETKMPAVVDSAAIAGMVDLIRCKGCFALSIRYAICLGLPTSQMSEDDGDFHLPSFHQYERIGEIFEESLKEFQNENTFTLEVIGSSPEMRTALSQRTAEKLNANENANVIQPLNLFIGNEESGSGMYTFAHTTISGFFDNDLLNTIKIFLANAKGSFGLCVTSSLDSHRQMCLAARGQTISIAFYPQTNLVLYGSEQAAVKAGLNVVPPNLDSSKTLDATHLDVANDVLRLDLDDVGGEICLLDWGTRYSTPATSPVNRDLEIHSVMNGDINVVLHQESSAMKQPESLHHRMTKLTRNPLITSLKDDQDDPILQDIDDIPEVCQNIQLDWRNVKTNSSAFNLNRLTAWNLGRCLKERLEQYASGSLEPSSNRVDILLTGCEVSLWLAEQFASDLQKSFPKLRVVAMSSNKLLGLYGQDEINIPTVGFSVSDKSLNLFDAITIIVSHSGGTFAPLGCSSLFQSTTKNIFVVTSEWDTQIGKQLRSWDNDDGLDLKVFLNSRIFSTGVGMRPAEPCSISVVATHQLLTNILEFIAIVVLSDDRYRSATGAVITERDLSILERCNRDNVYALTQIVGAGTRTEQKLRQAGDIWADHILENVKAYIMTFIYIFATVVSGYPIFSGIASGAGLVSTSRLVHFFRFLDALVYFFLPQINVIILRIVQKRPLLHRMVGRTVVIGDIPWVAQSAEAFLSKIFASSYSIAGLNVHSANPSDHLVHRMTHRVVRGTLLVCGRPDGRLSALTAMESAVCLSVNQASSIQSLGSTCESVTIGHNPFKLPLSTRGIFLDRNRPIFLCERLLRQQGGEEEGLDVSGRSSIGGSSYRLMTGHITSREESPARSRSSRSNTNIAMNREASDTFLDETLTGLNRNGGGNRSSRRSQRKRKETIRSSAALLGQYKTLEQNTIRNLAHDHFLDESHKVPLKTVLDAAIHERKWSDSARRLFERLDTSRNQMLSLEEFVKGLSAITERSEADLTTLFHQFDKHNEGQLSFDHFYELMTMSKIQIEESLQPSIRDENGLIQVQASQESFFGQNLMKRTKRRGASRSGSDAINGEEEEYLAIGATKCHNFAMQLYESRIGSLQRFVSMTVMFHQMGFRVQNFFSKWSLGFLGYRMDRTHSIMRIATTASPVSGADVRDRKQAIFYMRKIHYSVQLIESAWLAYKARKANESIDEKKSDSNEA